MIFKQTGIVIWTDVQYFYTEIVLLYFSDTDEFKIITDLSQIYVLKRFRLWIIGVCKRIFFRIRSIVVCTRVKKNN